MGRAWEEPLEEEMATHSNILARKFYRQRSLMGYGPWSRKESYTAETTGHARDCHIQQCVHRGKWMTREQKCGPPKNLFLFQTGNPFFPCPGREYEHIFGSMITFGCFLP